MQVKENHPQVFRLANGIRVAHLQVARPVSHAGLLMNIGSRDEMENEHGLAHFIEHSLFKGTTNRKTFHIVNRLDSVGGELNAFTSKEETWIHASFLNEHLERALELIADIAFNSTFPASEIDKEKDVIADEIRSYLDSPSEMLFEEFEAMVFANHPLGRNILGTEKSLRSFKPKDLRNFIARRNSPVNFVLSVVSHADSKTIKQVAEKYFGAHRFSKPDSKRKKFSTQNPAQRIEKKDVYQSQWIAGGIAYGYHDERRIGLSLLNHLLGGPSMNNRLSLSLREKHGLTYNVESNYQPLSDTGLFYVYLGAEKENLERSQQLLRKELDSLKHKKLGHAQLHNLKKQVKGQIALSQDNSSAIMFAIGKSLQLFNKIEPLEKVFQQIDDVTSTHLIEIANEILDEKKWSSLVYHS